MGESEFNGQVDAIHQRLEKLESRIHAIESSIGNTVQQQQLDMAMDRALLPLVQEVNRRFHQQEESSTALKSMINGTDELLGRLLVYLEGNTALSSERTGRQAEQKSSRTEKS